MEPLHDSMPAAARPGANTPGACPADVEVMVLPLAWVADRTELIERDLATPVPVDCAITALVLSNRSAVIATKRIFIFYFSFSSLSGLEAIRWFNFQV
jgi:hypothetical protein